MPSKKAIKVPTRGKHAVNMVERMAVLSGSNRHAELLNAATDRMKRIKAAVTSKVAQFKNKISPQEYIPTDKASKKIMNKQAKGGKAPKVKDTGLKPKATKAQEVISKVKKKASKAGILTKAGKLTKMGKIGIGAGAAGVVGGLALSALRRRNRD